MTTHTLHIRDARDDERAAIRQLTETAYAQYATIMVPTAWAGLKQAVHAGLDAAEAGVERIVAERNGAINIHNRVGHVRLASSSPNGGLAQEAVGR